MNFRSFMEVLLGARANNGTQTMDQQFQNSVRGMLLIFFRLALFSALLLAWLIVVMWATVKAMKELAGDL